MLLPQGCPVSHKGEFGKVQEFLLQMEIGAPVLYCYDCLVVGMGTYLSTLEMALLYSIGSVHHQMASIVGTLEKEASHFITMLQEIV